MKNLLFILADEWRADVAYHLKYPFVQTPHLDQLRTEAITVSHAFCQYPVCGPSRASLLTGKYPQQIGVLDNNSLMPDTERTIGHHLRDLGYLVDAFGKTHGMNPGFRLHHEPDALQSLGTTNMGYQASSDSITGIFEPGMAQHYDSIVTREVIDALAKQQGRVNTPFAIFVGLHGPHPPLYPPREYEGMYDHVITTLPEAGDDVELDKPQMQRRIAETRWLCHPVEIRKKMIANYLALTTFVDTCIGQLVAALQDFDLLDDTLVIITSDHGDQLGEHQLIGKFNNLYEGSIRVPLVLRLPNQQHAGREIADLVELVDLYPTICDLMSVPVPVGLSGMSLRPTLDHPQLEHRQQIIGMIQHGQMIRTRQWKLAYYAADLPELYDLVEDVSERHNRYDDPDLIEIRHELMEQLLDHLILFQRHPSHTGLNHFLA